ncbi:thiol-disulfide oxidoreductase DCC family protein [Thermophagus xiamenensis]|nr:DCC1-like thiol-disulfide oxidoreductase family protein [Thermophagus xiamenensis]
MKPITVIFDGYCVLCSGFARWFKKRAKLKTYMIAAQSEEGRQLLKEANISMENFDEVVVKKEEGKFLSGPLAILFLLSNVGRIGRICAWILKLLPDVVIRWGYRVIAKNRYKWFGKRSTCTVITN